MKLRLCLTVAFSLVLGASWTFGEVVDFEDLTLAPDSFFDGYGSDAAMGSWQSGNASFNTNRFGPGWSYSNVDDTMTSGFANQWAAWTGSGRGGDGNYAMVNSFDPNGAVINLPDAMRAESVWIANSTYAALSMEFGDGFAKQFGGVSGDDEDFFKIVLTGFDELDASGTETGAVEFFLADYRFADNSLDYILDTWASVDLTSLGNPQSIGVSFESSDVGMFGINTPVYAALDDLTLVPVPEPGSFGIGLLCLMGLGYRRRR